MSPPKIFQIGFNRCGTRSITKMFRDSGYRAAHWRKGQLAKAIHNARENGKQPFTGHLSDHAFFSDIEYLDYDTGELIEGYKYYEFLHERFPDALFLLNYRGKEAWLMSRTCHRSGNYIRFYAKHYGVRDPREVIDRWAEDWDDHLTSVRSFFAEKPGLLVEYDLDTDPPEKLTEAFAPHYTLDATAMRQVGARSRITADDDDYPRINDAEPLSDPDA